MNKKDRAIINDEEIIKALKKIKRYCNAIVDCKDCELFEYCQSEPYTWWRIQEED